MFQGRLDHAVLLYRQGRADSVMVVGAKAPGDTTTEAQAGRDYLVAQGVPANIITTEGRSFSELKVTEADCRAQGKAKTRTALIACFEPNRRVDIRATGEQPG